jgi:tRNA threonylcarbamoyladenosine biosynthesis protein TsaE
VINVAPDDPLPSYERYVICRSVEETERLAASFASLLSTGSFVALLGPLGAGKSVVARAIGAAWGVSEPMPSPTYTIMTVHQGRVPIYHMDLYRVGSQSELEMAGLSSYFQSDGISLVEWADRARELWPCAGWEIVLDMRAEDERKIVIRRFKAPR